MKTAKLQKLADRLYGQNQTTIEFSAKTKTYFISGNNRPKSELGTFDQAKQTLEERIFNSES